MRSGHDRAPLTGQVAVVTGASSGLGRRFARVLARHGVAVIACARRAERLIEVEAEIGSDGGQCLAVVLDVTDGAACASVFDRAEARFGPVTALVNNAAAPVASHITKLGIDDVDLVLATNVRGPWLLSTELARRAIARRGGGRIVNVSSMSAFHYAGTEGTALYSMTKAALNRMTEIMAVEWAPFGINVNAIVPGSFRTEMYDRISDRAGDLVGRFPRHRLGSAEQLDSTLLYLLDPTSEMVTGTLIKVDDGQTPR